MLLGSIEYDQWRTVFVCGFQWAPTLGGECYYGAQAHAGCIRMRFNGHPPLGVNATQDTPANRTFALTQYGFQWAPTLGGECYGGNRPPRQMHLCASVFQWAPTLGGECYASAPVESCALPLNGVSMGTHPWG